MVIRPALAAWHSGWPAGAPPGAGIGRQAAQRLARTELARPKYHPSPSLRQLITDYLSRLLNHGQTLRFPGGWWAPAVLVLLLVVLAAGITAWNRSLHRPRRLSPAGGLPGGDRTAREHYLAAEGLAQAGDYTAASLECVRAAAAALEERQLLAPRPGRTADEFAAEAGQALPAEAAALWSAAAAFDALCYGKRPGSAAGYQQLAGLAARLGAEPGRRRSGTAREQAVTATAPGTR